MEEFDEILMLAKGLDLDLARQLIHGLPCVLQSDCFFGVYCMGGFLLDEVDEGVGSNPDAPHP